MEKIKSLLSHSKSQDTENTGTGQTTTPNPTGTNAGVAGEGSHFGNTRDTTARDASRVPGAFPSGTDNTAGTQGVGSTNTGSGLGNTHNSGLSSGTGQTTTTGPHSSNVANKADPRIDSDNSQLGNSGLTGTSGTSNSGGISSGTGQTTTSGPHSSNIANRGDPRIDSDNSRTAGYPGTSVSNPDAGLQTSSGLSGAGQGSHLSRDNERNLGSDSGYTGTGSGLTGANQSSGQHLGRDAAVVGAAGGVGEGIHHHNQHQGNLGSNTTQTGSGLTGQTLPHRSGPGVTGTNQSSGLGRDAAALGTTGALGEGTHHHHQGTTGTGTTGQTLHHTGPEVSGAHQGSGNHLGRDAAAIGTAGAVGEGIHHHNQGNSASNTGLAGSSGAYYTGPIGSAVDGPHNTTLANTLDPHVNTRGVQNVGLEDAHHHSEVHGGGAEEADHSHGTSHGTAQTTCGADHGPNSPGRNNSSGHHLGRDAGVAGGVGGAAYEAEKHRGTGSSNTGTSNTQNTSSGHHLGRDAGLAGGVGGAAYEAEKHRGTGSSNIGTSNTQNTSSGHHLGRDAGLAGGVGGAAYEAEKHHGTGSSNTEASSTGPAPNTAGPHKQDWLNKLDPRVNQNDENTTESTSTGSTTQQSTDPAHHGSSTKDHHVGRDAAVAGGVGAAGGTGYEATKHHHHDGVDRSDPNADSIDRTRDHRYGRDAAVAGGVGGAAYGADKHHQDKHLEKEAKKEHKHEVKEERHDSTGSKGGFLSFLHRDKNKKYSQEEEADFARQEREHNSSHGTSHTGRDAALGGAAVGAGAYEADKHHHSHETGNNKALPTAPGNNGIGTGAGTGNALAGQTGHQGHGHSAIPLEEKTRGTDLGDKLHGADRNRGVAGSSGFPETQGYGSGTSGTTADQHSGVIGGNHTGRDAAALGGASAIGGHEYRKHENTTGQHSGSQPLNFAGSGQQSDLSRSGQHSGLTGSGQQSGVTGHQSGLTGEHSNLTGTSGQHSNPTGSGEHFGTSVHNHPSSGISEATTDQDGNTIGGDNNIDNAVSTGRNRLHKDPPASYSQGGASGGERERVLAQGQQRLGNDSGVHNSGATSGGTNY